MTTKAEFNAAKARVLAVIEYLAEHGTPDHLKNNGAFLGAYLAGATAAFTVMGDTVASGVALRSAVMAAAHGVIDRLPAEVEPPAA